jgi:hypothetical protein
MSAAAELHLPPSVPRLSFLERQAAEEGIARNYVARLRNDTQVEILSHEVYTALSPFERSVEGSFSEAQTGTFRTLAALGFKHAEVEAYVKALDSVPVVLPSFPGGGGTGEHYMNVLTVLHFHSRVTFALQTFGLLPLQRASAAPL